MVNNGTKWEIHIYYKIDGKQLKIRDSKGLNTEYYYVTLEQLIEQGHGKRKANSEILKRSKERQAEADNTIADYTNYIATREFLPTTKAFLLPLNEQSLITLYQDYLNHCQNSGARISTMKQYRTQYNKFVNYLNSINQQNITLDKISKDLYIDYLLTLSSKTAKYYNDVYDYHSRFYNYLDNVSDLVIRKP